MKCSIRRLLWKIENFDACTWPVRELHISNELWIARKNVRNRIVIGWNSEYVRSTVAPAERPGYTSCRRKMTGGLKDLVNLPAVKRERYRQTLARPHRLIRPILSATTICQVTCDKQNRKSRID